MTGKYLYIILNVPLFIFTACCLECESTDTSHHQTQESFLQYYTSDRNDVLTGGVKMIPIHTSAGTFNIWTKRVGNNPRIKVLLLHGGPGMTHEYFEAFDSYFPAAQVEYYYYDQLDSYYSDQPNDQSLWNIDRFVEEVEQVRQALNLTKENFFLLGQSWGGILAIEYALRYQEQLKGLIISNMMSSVPAYNRYAQEVLGPQLGEEIFGQISALERAKDFENPKYQELVQAYYYPKHVLRMPLLEWPEPFLRTFRHLNVPLYTHMQGYSEFGITEGATLREWDRTEDLFLIDVPTLVIGATYDTMDPAHMKWMASELKNGTYLHCPDGSHLAIYDDQKVYMEGIIQFLHEVDHGHFQ